MSKKAYIIKVVLVSLVFLPLNIAALVLLGEQVTWLHVGIIMGVLALVDVVFITVTGRPSKPKKHADPS